LVSHEASQPQAGAITRTGQAVLFDAKYRALARITPARLAAITTRAAVDRCSGFDSRTRGIDGTRGG